MLCFSSATVAPSVSGQVSLFRTCLGTSLPPTKVLCVQEPLKRKLHALLLFSEATTRGSRLVIRAVTNLIKVITELGRESIRQSFIHSVVYSVCDYICQSLIHFDVKSVHSYVHIFILTFFHSFTGMSIAAGACMVLGLFLLKVSATCYTLALSLLFLTAHLTTSIGLFGYLIIIFTLTSTCKNLISYSLSAQY